MFTIHCFIQQVVVSEAMNVEWLGVLNVPCSLCRQTDAQSDWWVFRVEELVYVPDYMVVSVASQLISREF